MMYWIVFALFTTLETFLDIFFSWFPFYYEIKILFILWVLSPATRGSSLLYKKLVHPMLMAREKEIDELIEKTKQQGYTTFLHLFSTGFEAASNFFVKTALNGQSILGSQLKKSLSMNDVYNEQADTASLGSKKVPETITESQDSEDSSDSANDHKGIKKPSSNANSRKPSLNTRDFEIIDDNTWMPDEMESRRHQTRRQLPPNPSTATTASTRRAAQNAASNYKSNEVYLLNDSFAVDLKLILFRRHITVQLREQKAAVVRVLVITTMLKTIMTTTSEYNSE